MDQTTTIPTGVQELIDRLRRDGTQAGQEEAERVVNEAKREAQQIVQEAKSQAASLLSEARAQIETDEQAAIDALSLAIRDARLKLASELSARFSARIKKLVEFELNDKDMLRNLILAVAARSFPEELRDKKVELLVSECFVAKDESASGEGEETLKQLIRGISKDMLREGIEINLVPGQSKGFRARAVGKDVELDLSEEGISELLLSHLLPKFRELYQGIGD